MDYTFCQGTAAARCVLYLIQKGSPPGMPLILTEAEHWALLILAQPKLADLLTEIQALHTEPPTTPFCANDVWFRPDGLHRRMSALVGWEADGAPPIAAYDTAYNTLYAALPDCRECTCFPGYLLDINQVGDGTSGNPAMI